MSEVGVQLLTLQKARVRLSRRCWKRIIIAGLLRRGCKRSIKSCSSNGRPWHSSASLEPIVPQRQGQDRTSNVPLPIESLSLHARDENIMAAWLPSPVMFESSRAFDCDGFDSEQCDYYTHPWRDCGLDVCLANGGILHVHDWRLHHRFRSHTTACSVWQQPQKFDAAKAHRSCSIFVLSGLSCKTLEMELGSCRGAAAGHHRGDLFLLYVRRCFTASWERGKTSADVHPGMDLAPSPYYWPGASSIWGNSPPLGTRSGWLALACMPFLLYAHRSHRQMILGDGTRLLSGCCCWASSGRSISSVRSTLLHRFVGTREDIS
nr:hypothetical protein CFP56_53721 [Quercus suber]